MNLNVSSGDKSCGQSDRQAHMPNQMNSNESAGSEQKQIFDVTQCSPEYLQRKLYFLVNKLKEMHSKLPAKFQSRISYELLSELASSLLNETAFEIVKGLIDIQHTTEEHLHKMRVQVEKECQVELEEWVSKITDDEEMRHILQLMAVKHTRKLKETDAKIVAMLDEKMFDQQLILHQAGIAGFYLTSNAKEINIQMFLLDFIIRLSRIKYEGK